MVGEGKELEIYDDEKVAPFVSQSRSLLLRASVAKLNVLLGVCIGALKLKVVNVCS